MNSNAGAMTAGPVGHHFRGLGFGLAGFLVVLDQVTKYWVLEVIDLDRVLSINLLPVLSLTYTENRGVSMGLLQADGELGRWALVVLTAAISLAVLVWIWRETSRWQTVALGLVLGGAIGNIIDRVRFGYVVDFVHVHVGRWSFYIFNVADMAITVGVGLLLILSLAFGRSKPDEPVVENGP